MKLLLIVDVQMLVSTDPPSPVTGAGQAGLLCRTLSSLSYCLSLKLTNSAFKKHTQTIYMLMRLWHPLLAGGPLKHSHLRISGLPLISRKQPCPALLPVQVFDPSPPRLPICSQSPGCRRGPTAGLLAPSPISGQTVSPQSTEAHVCIRYYCHLNKITPKRRGLKEH